MPRYKAMWQKLKIKCAREKARTTEARIRIEKLVKDVCEHKRTLRARMEELYTLHDKIKELNTIIFHLRTENDVLKGALTRRTEDNQAGRTLC